MPARTAANITAPLSGGFEADVRRGGDRHKWPSLLCASLEIEWNLLVLGDVAKPQLNLLYAPEHAKVGLEVKLSGVVGKAITITRSNFERARAAGVKCCYVSFCDRRNAAATTENLGFPCFNLTWSHGPNKPHEDSGQWPLLLKFLRA